MHIASTFHKTSRNVLAISFLLFGPSLMGMETQETKSMTKSDDLPRTSFCNLPPEIHAKFLPHLPNKDLCSIACVNQEFYSLVQKLLEDYKRHPLQYKTVARFKAWENPEHATIPHCFALSNNGRYVAYTNQYEQHIYLIDSAANEKIAVKTSKTLDSRAPIKQLWFNKEATRLVGLTLVGTGREEKSNFQEWSTYNGQKQNEWTSPGKALTLPHYDPNFYVMTHTKKTTNTNNDQEEIETKIDIHRQDGEIADEFYLFEKCDVITYVPKCKTLLSYTHDSIGTNVNTKRIEFSHTDGTITKDFLSISPQGLDIAYCRKYESQNCITIFNIKDFTHTFFKNTQEPTAVCFSASGSEIIIGFENGSLKITNHSVQQVPNIVFKPHKSAITKVAYSPNGTIVSMSTDNTLAIHRPMLLPTLEEIQERIASYKESLRTLESAVTPQYTPETSKSKI